MAFTTTRHHRGCDHAMRNRRDATSPYPAPPGACPQSRAAPPARHEGRPQRAGTGMREWRAHQCVSGQPASGVPSCCRGRDPAWRVKPTATAGGTCCTPRPTPGACPQSRAAPPARHEGRPKRAGTRPKTKTAAGSSWNPPPIGSCFRLGPDQQPPASQASKKNATSAASTPPSKFTSAGVLPASQSMKKDSMSPESMPPSWL